MSISVNDFRTGLTVKIDGKLYQIVEFLHVKPGKGAAFVRSKIKDIKTGNLLEKTFRGGEKIERAIIEHRKMQFTYVDDDMYHFMDMESYEDISIEAALLGDQAKWLKDGMEVDIAIHDEQPIGVEIPNFVELVVTQTEPGFKGDTATGATVNVPLFVEIGTKIQIDTRSGEYLRRL